MKRVYSIAGLTVLIFLAFCGTGHAVSVTLVESPSTSLKGTAASGKQPIVLTFGSERVVIHGGKVRVPGRALTGADVPLSQLYLVRDQRALSLRTEYETVYQHGPFLLAVVANPVLLDGVKHISLEKVTRSMVVTRVPKPARYKTSDSVQNVLNKIDRTRYGNYLSMLAGDEDMPTRYACSSSATTAHGLIVSAFQEIGMDELITDQRFTVPSGGCEWDCTEIQGLNVIAIKQGKTRPDDYYVVGAHYDSINDTTSPCRDAPGAGDNASGVAGVLELANAFNAFTTDASIVFVAFGGEEIDLLGSYKYVNDLVSKGMKGNVKAFIALDMISWYQAAQKIYVEGGNKNAAQKAAVNKIVKDTSTYTDLEVEYSYDFQSKGHGNSDHVPFLRAGMPGALIIQFESDSSVYTPLHTADDRVGIQKLPFAVEVLKVAAATLAGAGIDK